MVKKVAGPRRSWLKMAAEPRSESLAGAGVGAGLDTASNGRWWWCFVQQPTAVAGEGLAGLAIANKGPGRRIAAASRGVITGSATLGLAALGKC